MSYIDCSLYDVTTGEIVAIGYLYGAPSAAYLQQNGLSVYGGVQPLDPATQIVDIATGEPVQKSSIALPGTVAIAADGVDVASVSGIPVGCIVKGLNNLMSIIDDGVFEYVTDIPGSYDFIFSHTLYIDTTVTINAS